MTKLKKVVEWAGGNNESGTLRIYCGKLHCGTAYPCRRLDYYTWVPTCDLCVIGNAEYTLEDIKMMVELSLKEFLKKIIDL